MLADFLHGVRTAEPTVIMELNNSPGLNTGLQGALLVFGSIATVHKTPVTGILSHFEYKF